MHVCMYVCMYLCIYVCIFTLEVSLNKPAGSVGIGLLTVCSRAFLMV